MDKAVEAVRQARPHIKLYKKHYEVLRSFHSNKQIQSKSGLYFLSKRDYRAYPEFQSCSCPPGSMLETLAQGVARVTFMPTLAYNLVMERLSSRRWWDRVNDRIILGAPKEIEVLEIFWQVPSRSDLRTLLRWCHRKELLGWSLSMNPMS